MTDNGDRVPCVSELSCRERRTTMREVIERRIDHERELVRQAFEQRDVALEMQAKEYEHRLTSLNDNLRTMLEERRMFFTRDGHDAFLVEYYRFRDQANRQLTTIYTWGAAGLLVLSILEFLLRAYWR